MSGARGPAYSALSPADYRDEDVLRAERDTIFASAWQPVCRVEDVKNHQDFVCADVAGRGVVVRNANGSLRAFENVCSHRQSPIHTVPHGNGPLQCPYHGWTFDDGGELVGIPRRRAFGELDASTLSSLALESWAVQVVGPLVFVRARKDGPGVAHADGDGSADEVLATVRAARRSLANHALTMACNWKVIVENGLDAYHVPLVHPDTLQKHGLDEVARESHGDHSVGRFVAKTGARVLQALRYAYPGAAVHERYTHHFLFPNVYVVDVYGLFLTIARANPVDATHTRFDVWTFVTWDGPEGNQELREELNASNAAFFRAGYLEDQAICERVQSALQHTGRPAFFGAEEERIPMFHEAWTRHIAAASSAATHSRGSS